MLGISLCVFAVVALADDQRFRKCLQLSSLAFKWRGDASFESSIQVLSKIWVSNPIAVVRVKNALDASKAIVCANLDNRVVTARSGGHSYGGFSRGMNDGLVLDMRGMGNVSVDRVNEIVEFESGIRLGRLYTILDEAGHYIVPAGTCPGVGATGHTLGGGHGPLSPFYGMMSDNVVSMQVVLADGTITDIDAQHHPDLFWAMRGAGTGNFAVATKIRMKMYKVTQFSARFHWASEDPGRVHGCIALWGRHLLPGAGTVTETVRGKTRVWLTYLGPRSKLDKALKPLEQCIPSLSTARSEEYSSFYEAYHPYARVAYGEEWADLDAPPDEPEPPSWARSSVIQGRVDYSPKVMSVLHEFLNNAPANMEFASQILGGRINTIPVRATAFPLRDTNIQFAVLVRTDGEVPPPASEKWIDEFARALRAVTIRPHPYYNMFDVKDLEHAGTRFFGPKFPMLKRVAARYDPYNRFEFPMSVANLQF